MALDFRASQARTNKLIASGSTGTNAKLIFYPFSSALNLSGTINPSLFGTGSIGQDIFLYISGAIGSLDGTSNGATVTGGDLHVSGNLRVQGQLLFSSGSTVEFGLSDYTATSNTFSTIVGQHRFDPTDYLARPIYVRGNLAVSNVATNLSVRLWNVTAATYVEIGGPGVSYFVVSGTTPTFFQSVNLVSASGFSTGSAIYELHASVSNGSHVGYVGGWNFAVTGAGVQGPMGLPGSGGGADPGASYVVIALTGSLSNERVLAAGPGIAINDYGANASVAISASLIAGPGITINQVGSSYAISGSGTSSFLSSAVNTSNDTPTLLNSYAVSANTLADLNFQIVAKQDTFANYGRWQRNIVVGRSGSANAFVHSSASYAPITDVATTGSWGFNFEASGSNVNLYVTGSVATVVSWSCQIIPATV